MTESTTNREAMDLFSERISLARAVGQKLKAAGWLLAAAESCTGGGVAAVLTEIPGSSEWFAGGLVTYSNDWKKRLLGVREETLASHGAVSQETVAEMLTGLLKKHKVQAALAVSGIAGPGGAVPGKPVGTVFMGVACKGKTHIQCCLFPGNRVAVREQSVGMTLRMLLQLLEEKEKNIDSL
ncbi:MAG: CinA family protein [Lentisphaeria bacterium]